MYHYAGNNPIKYTDPDGRYSDEWINKLPASVKQYTKNMPTNRFSQQLWTVDKGFKSYMENGKEKFFWQTACLATSILNIVSEAYQKETGNIMTEVQAIEALNAAIDKVTYSHFVNALKNVIGSQYFDVWDAKTKDYLKLTTNEAGEEITQNLINLQKNRPIRGLDYNLPYKNWSMIDRESMEK